MFLSVFMLLLIISTRSKHKIELVHQVLSTIQTISDYFIFLGGGGGEGGAYNETTFTKLSTVLAKFRHICGNSSIRTENMAYHTTEKE